MLRILSYRFLSTHVTISVAIRVTPALDNATALYTMQNDTQPTSDNHLLKTAQKKPER